LHGVPLTRWFVVAGLMRKVLGSADDQSDEVRSAAHEVTGLSWGVLTRYLNVLVRVERAAYAANVAPDDLLSRGFNGVELAVRLFDRSAESGIEALRGLRDGTKTVSDVRKALDLAAPGGADAAVVMRSRLLRRNSIGIRAVEEAVEAARGGLFPEDSIIRRRRGLRYFRRTGIEVLAQDGSPLQGLDVVADPSSTSDPLDAGLAQSVLLSTFFPRFYLAVPPTADAASMERAVDILERLAVPWIGTLRATDERRLQIVREPSGPPVPDRSRLYREIASVLAGGRARSVPS
jgi:hypothetical protein